MQAPAVYGRAVPKTAAALASERASCSRGFLQQGNYFRGFLQQGDYFFLSDLTAGFHHLPMAREAWTYLGVELDGKYYVHLFDRVLGVHALDKRRIPAPA